MLCTLWPSVSSLSRRISPRLTVQVQAYLRARIEEVGLAEVFYSILLQHCSNSSEQLFIKFEMLVCVESSIALIQLVDATSRASLIRCQPLCRLLQR